MSRTRFHLIVAVSLLVFCASPIPAQNAPAKNPPRPEQLRPAKWNPSPQEVFAAYWTLEPGWNTELEMRNNLTFRELIVTPVLRTADGQEASLAPVTIAPQHIVSLDLRSLAQSDPKILNDIGFFGSAAFHFSGLDPGNLFAAAIVNRQGRPIDFHFDADYAVGSGYSSGGIEGIWWLPTQSSTDYLVLSNPSPIKVDGTLVLSSASGGNRSISLEIGPAQTKRIDLREALGLESAASMGGLTVLLPGKESLSASHIVFDEVTGLAAMMKLFYRETDDKPRNHSLLAPMLALSQPDRGLGFPATTTLIPQIFLRNAGPDSTLVSLKVDWRNETKSGEFVLQPLTLASGAVTVVNVEDPQRSGQIPGDASWATVKLAYVGKKADLIPVAISYDKELRYGLQTPFSEAMSRMWAGGMWHVDSTHNTFIATGNGGSGPTTAEATLFYNGGKDKYRIEKKLAPGEQLWLDVGKVLRDQVVDSEGRTLPPDTMTGSYELRDLDHPYVGQLYEGKLVIDKTYGHAAYGCASCCQYSVPYFLVNPFAGPPDDDFGETLESTDSCGGLVANVTDGGYDWASSNTAIATLSSPTLHTVAPGSATGSVAIQLQHGRVLPNGECPAPVFGPTQPLAVGPYQVEPIDTASQGPAQCPSGSAGWVRNVTNQLQYQNGSAYAVDGLTVSDTLSIGSTNELGLHGQQTGQATTTGDGSFPDTYSVCSTDCPSSGYSNVLQQWTAYGVPLPHVNGVVYKCQSITIDGN